MGSSGANLSGTYVPLSTIDAADDLLVGSADNAVTRLAVAASRIIGKKSTGGLAALTGAEVADIVFPTFASGVYHGTPVAAKSTGTVSSGQLLAAPFFVRHTTTFDRIAAEVTSFTANALLRLGVYATLATGLPGALVFEAGTIDAGASNSFKTITINQQLTPGLYWLTSLAETATATYRLAASSSDFVPAQGAATSTLSGGFFRLGVATGALPANYGTPDGVAGPVPYVNLRAA